MKKISVITLSLIILITACGKKKQDTAVVRAGMINFLVGEVFIASTDKTVPAKVGDAVIEGMKIVTYDNSSAEIYFEENVIKIMGNSSVEIAHLISDESNAEKTGLFVENGQVFTKVSKKLIKGDDFRISTPTATAAVRGTDFMLTEQDGKSMIECLEGKIEVLNTATPSVKPVQLNSGEEVTVEPGRQMLVKALSERNKKKIQNIKSDIKNIQEDIRKKFEAQREEIRQAVIDQKEKNIKMVEEQKALNRKNLEDIKESGKAEIESLKGVADSEKNRAADAVSKQKDEQKDLLDSVKPDIKKFKSEIK